MRNRTSTFALLLALVATLLAAGPAAATDERAATTRTSVDCGLGWLTADGQPTQLDGTGTVVERPQAGTFTLRCKVTVPDDPSLASFETVCGAVGDDCVNGVVIVVPRDSFYGCTTGTGASSTEAFAVATGSGQYMFVCHGQLASP